MDVPKKAHHTGHPSFVEHLLAIAMTAVILEQHSRFPETGVMAFFMALLITVALFVAYAIRAPSTREFFERPRSILRWSTLHWLVLPAAMLIMIGSACTHWPASVRLSLSQPAFDELVARAERGGKPRGFPRRVGWYWIREVYDLNYNYHTGEGELGFVTGVALIDPCGLCYDRSNHPTSHFLKTRIAPCWYLTEW